MKTLTKEQARAGAMTADEAGEGTVERALQIEGSMAALLSRQSSSLEDWTNLLKVMRTTRPWMHLPTKGKPYGEVFKWTQTQFKVGDEPLGREQLVRIIDAYAPNRGKPIVAEFEAAIEQPYVAVAETHGGARPGSGPKPKGSSYPDNLNSCQSDRQRGTSADYLMAQLIAKVGTDVVEQIGPGRQFPSVMAAAVHYGIAKRRVRYEVTPDCNTGNAAARIVEVLGPDKAAELVAALTVCLTLPTTENN
jgi:hypothetical protein